MLTNNIPVLLAVALALPLASVLAGKQESRRLPIRLFGAVELGLIALLWLYSFASPVDTPFLRLQPLNLTVLLLISFIGVVVTHYAATSLSGETDEARFLSYLSLTRFAVMVVVASNNLLVLWLAWSGISVSLHRLLLFYPERPRAILAAHKKFLIARLTELMLAVACWLLYDVFGTLQISSILTEAAQIPQSFKIEFIAILLAGVAILKCAQMPVHGWLIQVVEAPTPVSALLHAGIVNLGGFLLLQFAPVFDGSLVARWLILLIAGPSTVIAALIMSTRISIKVRLAWSTIAQMGLMLIECALGLHELVLLHLLAHACYKAHAFLSSGNAVNEHLAAATRQAQPLPHRDSLIAGATTGIAMIVLVLFMEVDTILTPWLLVSFAAVTLIPTFNRRIRGSAFIMLCGLPVALLIAYVLAKSVFATLLAVGQIADAEQFLAQDLFIYMLLMMFYGAWSALQLFPGHPVMQRLFIMLNAGFYLDEWTTRFTLFLWPVRLPQRNHKSSALTREYAS